MNQIILIVGMLSIGLFSVSGIPQRYGAFASNFDLQLTFLKFDIQGGTKR